MKIRLHVRAIGIAAPGLDDATALHALQAGAAMPQEPDWQPAPRSLPRRQALRLSETIRLAIMATEQVGDAVPRDGGWVFASSTGEGDTLHDILMALRDDEIMIQPLKFQNAVHNAAQGQWSILAGATGPMTSIAAYDETAGAGLLKAAMHCAVEGTPVGLVVFDSPLPAPLHEKRPFTGPAALSIALHPEAGPADLATLEIETVDLPAVTTEANGNPAFAMLPLLRRVLAPSAEPVVLGLPGGTGLAIRVTGPDPYAIAFERMPHEGAMRLVDRIIDADEDTLRCIARPHAAPDYPLRVGGVLHASALVEIGAQAAALHASLHAVGAAHAGLVLSLGEVELIEDDVRNDVPIEAEATRLAGEYNSARYRFWVTQGDTLLVHGNLLLSLQRTEP